MPYIQCAGCGKSLEINIVERDCWNTPRVDSNPSKVIGSATCRHCNTGTGFEIVDNVISYVSSKSSYGKLDVGITDDIKMLYAEAELCFQNGSPNASAAMCRAATELALNKAKFEGKDLFGLIEDARKKGKLDEIEAGLAHSSRLITRNAIHRGEFVSLADIPSMLSATIKIVNKLSPISSSTA